MLYINKHINYTMNWMNSYKNQTHKADQPKDSQKDHLVTQWKATVYYICNNCL